jgi:peptidoglycan/xylan/chitin deacetylase (PgdA/CDA1 family)
MFYFVKKPKWLRRFYGDCLWEVDTSAKELYLTFDAGPHPEETPFVLDELKKYNAKATFFCIGENVVAHPQMLQRIVQEGHSIGNHTQSHIDGWKTRNKKYYADIQQAAQVINTRLFRPPFGHITWNQVKALQRSDANLKTVLWCVLCADFDEATPHERCLENVIASARPGSIILFHDSDIASRNMRYSLPRVLDHFTQQGYSFKAITA